MLWRLVKLVFFLAVVGFAGLTGFAYLGDMTPAASPVDRELVLTPD